MGDEMCLPSSLAAIPSCAKAVEVAQEHLPTSLVPSSLASASSYPSSEEQVYVPTHAAPCSASSPKTENPIEKLRTTVLRLTTCKDAAAPELRCLQQQLNEHVLAWEADEAWCEDLSPGDAKSECRVLSQEDLLSRAFD